MASKLTRADRAIVRLADGTVKQQNLLTGTEVWTVPGRGNRPLSAPHADRNPIDHEADGHHCAFCSGRYLETPPEKSRLVRHEDGTWEQLDALGADQLTDTVAEFRRIPNLFEIVSYNYWHLNHGHVPSEEDRRRMAHYLASDAGYEHVMNVVRARMLASGMSEGEFAATSETARLQAANGFFSGGHDLIIGRRHYVDGATEAHQLAGSGTLTPEEHAQYTAYTARSMRDLYDLDPAVRYVATFQNWLRPAGASFDHLHKQLVAIDDLSVQTEAELERLRAQPDIYDQIFTVAATRKLLIAQNEHAVALAGFGHRFPGIAIWPLGQAANPWEVSPEAMRGISDILHAAHAATGVEVPANEEWYHRPPTVSTPMRWRILLKWRISTLAGFEGGTRIYLNTIDPWKVVERTVPRLLELRDRGLIAQNEHAVALDGFGHRFPGIAIWPLGQAANPWEVSPEAMRGISDILHAAHAATGVEVPANEEWYHRPPTVSTPMRWRILLKWRISTLAGFEGGTRIYLNTIDPWKVVERTVPRLLELREAGLIAPMRIGEECKVSPAMLRG